MQPTIQMGGSELRLGGGNSDIWVSGLRGDSMGQEGTCWRLAAAALPPDLTHPRVCLLLSLCPGGM